jgi:uncharacterized MAPEG superfamily protein
MPWQGNESEVRLDITHKNLVIFYRQEQTWTFSRRNQPDLRHFSGNCRGLTESSSRRIRNTLILGLDVIRIHGRPGVLRTFVGTSPMTPELRYLVYSTILGLLQLIAASHFISYQYGYRWTASNRDEEKPSLKGIVGRVDRAGINFLETFPFFAALVIAAHLVNRDSSLTLWAARFYFWGRLIYAVAYSAGFPILRSAIWNVATGGIILLIIALLR